MGKLVFSDKEARHSLEVSNHWAWSRGGGLLVRFLITTGGKWSKIAAHETMFQVLMMERMLSNERQLRISQSA